MFEGRGIESMMCVYSLQHIRPRDKSRKLFPVLFYGGQIRRHHDPVWIIVDPFVYRQGEIDQLRALIRFQSDLSVVLVVESFPLNHVECLDV